MRFRVLAIAACGAAILGAFLPIGGGGTVPAVEADSRRSDAPRIQIKHEVVRIPVTEVNTVAPAPNEPAQPSPLGLVGVAARAKHTRMAGRPDAAPARGVVQRAVRTLVGDGRYRPSPFPTPGR